jgi:ABC-2 type transport system permease protein
MTGAHELSAALELVLRQWMFVGVAFVLMQLFWRRGISRFAAYGG